MNRIASFVFICLLFASCAPFIMINDTSYRKLTSKQLKELRQFGDADTGKHYLIEITHADLQRSLPNAKYTCVYYWLPYCKSDNCKPLDYYNGILREHEADGLQLFIVSPVYNYKTVKEQLQHYDGDVFVLKNDIYGNRTFRNWEMFNKNLVPGMPKEYWRSRLIFKNDSLIYAGAITNQIVDSVLLANP